MTEEVNYWFVGAYNDDEKLDRAEEFVRNGIWVNMFKDRLQDNVNSMKPGDKIAIKSTFTQRKDLPFDNRNQSVSVMAIKAIGTIISNLNDGHTVKVDWKTCEPIKHWYFYTHRKTIWKLNMDKPLSDDLVRFAFKNESQDLDKFRNDPFWRDRFGDLNSANPNFAWTAFYEELASAIRLYRNNRKELLEILEKITLAVPAVKFPQDQYADGTTGPWQDICPFSFLAFLNRQFKIENRIAIAETMASEFDLTSPVPASFEGIPTMLHQSAWFFTYADQRHPDDIDKLWDLFEALLDWADETVIKGDDLEEAFNKVISIKGIKWNITLGMYWARPWSFMPLDAKSRNYLERHLRINVCAGDETKVINGNSLINLINALKLRFEDKQFPAHSFPELSHKAYLADYIDDGEEGLVNTEPTKIEATEIYSIENILNEGSFIEKRLLTEFLSVWKDKKNLILQGPPGTGKTWLAKRLGYALMDEKSKSRLVSMQFHSNLSYEDFVRGFRPTKHKELELVNGPFLEMIDRASSDPENKYVFVIEEINRGNPAQIFGELLTLLEKDKRNPEEALQITYKQGDELLYIPENLYVIGTMNLADKSLALMDFALRRRFAFIDLSPNLNDLWHSYVTKELELESIFAKKLKKAVGNLNDEISADPNLGEAFQLGHSFFIPPKGLKVNQLACKWFDGVVETEIKPTLKEYWFDNPNKVEKAIEALKNSVI